jgi:hypothetical protein
VESKIVIEDGNERKKRRVREEETLLHAHILHQKIRHSADFLVAAVRQAWGFTPGGCPQHAGAMPAAM